MEPWTKSSRELTRMNTKENIGTCVMTSLKYSLLYTMNSAFGFLEGVYEEALSMALVESGFTVARQVPTPIWFRGRKIGEYKADLIVNNAVLLELKSARTLEPAHGLKS